LLRPCPALNQNHNPPFGKDVRACLLDDREREREMGDVTERIESLLLLDLLALAATAKL